MKMTTRFCLFLSMAFCTIMLFTPGIQAQEVPSHALEDVILVHGAWADGSSWSKVIPRLEARGMHITAVQLPLTSLQDDVATVERAIALEPGPVLLAGHSYGGIVITEAGNDPKVGGLIYIAAYAPDAGDSAFTLNALVPATPASAEITADQYGFLKLTPMGIAEDFAQDLSDVEKVILTDTQGPTSVAVLTTPASNPAWKAKPSWYIIASEDRTISPQLEAIMAQHINAVTITVHSSHVVMLSKPNEVSDFILKAAQDNEATQPRR